MLFSTVFFLFVFLPIVLIIYFVVPKKFKNLILFVSSLIFYAWGEPIYVCIMIFSTLVDYTIGMLIHKNDKNEIRRKLLLLTSITINIGMLAIFKYSDFFIVNINNIFKLDISLMNLPLPIGISFYTFQTLSYTIDVYKRKVDVQKNIISFGTYVALFPQLIAGPIVRYITVSKEINERKVTSESFANGIIRFIQGLAKKVLIANNVGQIWSIIKESGISTMPTITAWIGIICFGLQIYFDFSGYSDMAIGLGKMFGFNFDENFNYPYTSKSITEFWRRWHISLSTWFKEYIYIPLGGNRKGLLKQIRNILIVWFLTGFWHGAEWNFIFWGIYFGVILIIEKVFLFKFLEKIPKVFSHIYTLLLIIFGWVLFDFTNISDMFIFIKNMFGLSSNGMLDSQTIYYIYTNIFIIVLAIIACTPLPKIIMEKIYSSKFKYLTIIIYISMFILSVAYLVDSTYNPFLYFRF